MSLVRTEQLSCHFGGIKAVNTVDFNLPEGEIRAIIGPNGAGKSTFVSMLCGRQQPTNGRVFFADKDITTMPAHTRARNGMAYTFQITSVFGNLPCYDNVELAVQSTRPPSIANRATQTRLALAKVGLEEHAQTLAKNLSYGHQRLLELAMGFALQPRLLMLDEPTQGLADTEIDNFKTIIRELAQSATVLLIEHNMDVVMQLAERITVLDAGSILAEGTPEQISNDRQVQLAYLGT